MRAKEFFNSRFWRLFKRVSLTLAFIFCVLLLISAWFISQKKEWIINQVVTYLNEHQVGEIEIGTKDLDWFTAFPDVAVEVHDVKLFERAASLRPETESPIIYASKVNIALDVWSLVRKSELKVAGVSMRGAIVNLLADSVGVLNIVKAFQNRSGTEAGGELIIDLNEVKLDSVWINFKSNSQKHTSQFLLYHTLARLNYANEVIQLNVESSQHIKDLAIKNMLLTKIGDVEAELDLTFDQKSKYLTLHASEIRYKELKLLLNGFYDQLNDQNIEINFDGSSNELVFLKMLIREDIVRLSESRLKSGAIDAKGKLFGKLNSNKPQLEVKLLAKDLDLMLPDDIGEFENIGFECSFSSGEPDDFSKAVLEIKNLWGKLPGGTLAGKMRIENFTKPFFNIQLNAKARVNGFDKIFKFENISQLKGTIAFASTYEGIIDFNSAEPPARPAYATLSFDNVSFEWLKTKKRITGLNGKIALADYEVALSDFKFFYDKSDITVNGKLQHPYYLLFNHEREISASLALQSSQLLTQDFMPDTLHNAIVQDTLRNFKVSCDITSTVSKIRNSKFIPDFTYNLKNLSGDFAKLPDILGLAANGELFHEGDSIVISINGLQCYLPGGSINFVGKLSLPGNEQLGLDGQLRLSQLPIQHVNALINEFQNEPADVVYEKLSDRKSSISGQLNLSLGLIVSPFTVKNLNVQKAGVDLHFEDGRHWKTDNLNLEIHDMFFRHPSARDSANGLSLASYALNVDPLFLTGIGKASITMTAKGPADPGIALFELNDVNALMQLPQGSLTWQGDVAFPQSDLMEVNGKLLVQQFPWSNFDHLRALVIMPEEKVSKSNSDEEVSIKSATLTADALFSIQPFGVKQINLTNSEADIQLTDSLSINTGIFSASLKDVFFKQDNLLGAGFKSIHGEIDFDSLDVPLFGKNSLLFTVNGSDDIIDVNIKSNILHAKSGAGSLILDLTKDLYSYKLNYAWQDIPTEYVSELIRGKQRVSGVVDMALDLRGIGLDQSSLRNLQGNILISGEHLSIYRVDLDGLLKDYKKSQNFNFVDVGAFMIAGPVGPMVTKGSDFVKLMTSNQEEHDKTDISQMILKASFSDGQLTSDDIALATAANRIALNGKVDFVTKNVTGITVTVLDRYGCSLMDQHVFGPYSNLQYGKLNVAGTLLAPVTNLASPVSDKKCKPVYTGSIKHPVKK